MINIHISPIPHKIIFGLFQCSDLMDELRGLIVGWDWMIECGTLWCVCVVPCGVCVVYVSLVFDLVEVE